jgi:hypothetical protein
MAFRPGVSWSKRLPLSSCKRLHGRPIRRMKMRRPMPGHSVMTIDWLTVDPASHPRSNEGTSLALRLTAISQMKSWHLLSSNSSYCSAGRLSD